MTTGVSPTSANTVPAALADVLAREREGVIEGALSVTRHIRTPHDAPDSPEVRERLERLYDAVEVAATGRNLGPIVEYAGRLAGQGYDRGYDLAELQAPFNALEESLWEQLLTDMGPSELGEALTLVSSIFGVAKDTLACAYVTRATRAKHPALDLDPLEDPSQRLSPTRAHSASLDAFAAE
jgi:hypothetical protein